MANTELISKLSGYYMQKGSEGFGVILLQAFLCGAGFVANTIILDGIYGKITADGVKKFQILYGLMPDGNFGPATRQVAKEKFLFDFEFALSRMSVGSRVHTIFVQPDSEKIHA